MTDRLRILSANLWSGGADPDALAKLLREQEVEVLAAQELSADQARAIAEVLPHGKLEPADDYTGKGIALLHPGEVSPLPIHGRAARLARLEWPGFSGPLEVVNIHVRAPHAFPTWRALATRRVQLRDLLSILDRPAEAGRVVIGDFNATPLWPVYRRVAERLRDAAHEHARRQGRKPARTWAPRPGLPRLLRIDHAFVSDVQVDHVEVVTIPGSDHAGLLLDIARR